jgi:hypothetical protein
MAARNRFVLEIVCPKCDASGEARVSEHHDPDIPDPAFRVDDYPEGFSEEKRSACCQETLVQCRCGQAFYLL